MVNRTKLLWLHEVAVQDYKASGKDKSMGEIKGMYEEVDDSGRGERGM